MAYCPRCKKEVDERWIECPACRTEVVSSKTAANKGKTRTLNKPPDEGDKKSMGFFGRFTGVLRFNPEAYVTMSIQPQFGELTLLFAAGIAILYAAHSALYSGALTAIAQGGIASASSMLVDIGILAAMAFYLVTGAIAHFIIKVLGGHAEYVVTLFVMLYVSLAWGIPAAVITIGIAALGMPLLLVVALWVFAALSIIASFIIGLSVVHGASKTATVIGLLSSYAAVAALFYYMTTGPDLTVMVSRFRPS